MITVNIAHYNRPYFLDLNIKLLRHFLGNTIRIIVADDGSDQEVYNRIKKFDMDDMYYNTKHWYNTSKRSGSFAKTMRKSVKLCKTEYYMFTEDDFIYLKSPIPTKTVQHMPTNGAILPKVPVGTDEGDIFEVAEHTLNTMPDIGMVKLQVHYRVYTRMMRKKNPVIESGGFRFYFARPIGGNCNSWPYIISQELANKIQCDNTKALHIWARQNYIKGQLMHYLHPKNVLIVDPGRVMHVGNGVSVNVTQTSTDKERKSRSQTLQKTLRNKVQSYHQFAVDLSKYFCSGRFYFDVDEVLEAGIDVAFQSAFDRLGE